MGPRGAASPLQTRQRLQGQVPACGGPHRKGQERERVTEASQTQALLSLPYSAGPSWSYQPPGQNTRTSHSTLKPRPPLPRGTPVPTQEIKEPQTREVRKVSFKFFKLKFHPGEMIDLGSKSKVKLSTLPSTRVRHTVGEAGPPLGRASAPDPSQLFSSAQAPYIPLATGDTGRETELRGH